MIEYAKAKQEEVPELARFIHIAFGAAPDGAATWLKDKLGLEQLRIMRSDATIVSCLGRIPMAQYFGGKSVPMLGIAGVATPPEHRGKGFAKQMMAEAVKEAAADGFPLSVLYASTQPLYRSVGFEHAGYRFVSKLPMQTLGVCERARDVVKIGDAEMPEVKACYAEFASAFPGMVDRTEYIWERIRNRREEKFHGFGVRENGRIGSYMFVLTEKPGRERGDLVVSDIAWRTPTAARKVIGLLSDFTTMTEHALVSGSPLHPLASFLPQQRFEIDVKEFWMLRIVRIKEAIEKRGYPKAINGSARFEMTDEIVPENAGRWRISVADGRGRCERDTGSGSAIRCDIRAFAPLYSGLYTASQARMIGIVEGDDESIEAADGLFACGTPWMTDFF